MPEENAITFEFIRDIQRREQKESGLTKITEDFYEKASEYMRQKKQLAGKKRDRKADLEIDNVERIIEDISDRRETKIVNQALLSARTGLIPENLIEQEKDFFESLVEMFRKHRERNFGKTLKGKKPRTLREITFLEDTPEFIGIDLKKYGPYSKGDKDLIPEENAKLFIQAGKAEKHE